MTRILVVEDEEDLALGIRANLEVEGYEVVVAHTGATALRAAASERPDLVLLDLMLPDTDGYQVLRALREQGVETPVLILTARGEEVDKVRGFRAGADDYLTKPFGVMELLVRIEALLRRSGARSGARSDTRAPRAERVPERLTPARPVVRAGDLEVDPDARLVRRAGADVSLTPKAFELLLALVGREGRVVSRHELLREVWGYDPSVSSRTVDTHVLELRRKLEPDPANPRHLLTVRKTGYRLT